MNNNKEELKEGYIFDYISGNVSKEKFIKFDL